MIAGAQRCVGRSALGKVDAPLAPPTPAGPTGARSGLRGRPRRTRSAWRHIGTGLACLLAFSAATARDPGSGGFEVLAAAAELRGARYWLDADVSLAFSEASTEALEAGIPLTVVLDTEVKRERPLFDKLVHSGQTRLVVHKHALSARYLVSDVATGVTRSFPSLAELTESVGRVRDMALFDADLVEPGHRYRLRLRARLDIEALPSPLRPLAYISRSWRLDSEWYSWSLTP